MCTGFVLLTNGAARNEVVDKHGKSRPPEVTFNNGFGMEMSKVAREGRGVDGVE